MTERDSSMARGEERYSSGVLARWLRPNVVQPDMFTAPGNLDTQHLGTLHEQTSKKVHVECSHQKSEWGQFEGLDAWAPYLQLSFRGQEKKPRWATLTVNVKPILVGAEEPASGAAVENGVPCLTTHVYPKDLTGGVLLSVTRTKGFNFQPSGGAAGVTIAVGNLSKSDTLTYANVLDKRWTIKAETARGDESTYHRKASWHLKATKRGKIIPDQLRVGAIIQHDRNNPFHLTVAVEGAIHKRFFGDYEFSGSTSVLTVKMTDAQKNANVKDFEGWATKMKEHMLELGYNPVPEVELKEAHEIL